MSDLYVQGAFVVDGVLAQSGSLKGLVMERARSAKIDAKRLLALTANTLAFRKPLEHALNRANVLTSEKKTLHAAAKGSSTTSLALVLAHDLLLTKRGRIATSPAWPPHSAISRHTARLRAELVKLQVQEGKKSVQELRAGGETKKKAERIPRWVRVNERLATVGEVMDELQRDGWVQVKTGAELQAKAKTFAVSQHVPSVLAVHSAHTSHLLGHPLYIDGRIILQDLASCFPAEILLTNEPSTSVIHALDATAAPGNKTTHLSAKLASGASGSKVSAFEHLKPRFMTLQKQLKRAGALSTTKAGHVDAILGDFTKQDPMAYKEVTHMLLDPSCSGSGILNRLDYLTEEQDEAHAGVSEADEVAGAGDRQRQRLAGLSAFQSAMIDHAMQFPALRRLVYSTCSVHHEENEDVVMRALTSEIAREAGWTLAPRTDVIPSWDTRGLPLHCNGDISLAQSMIRCTPGGEEDGTSEKPNLNATNGFFVACFVRKEGGGVEQARSGNTIKNRKRKERAKEKAKAAKKSKMDV